MEWDEANELARRQHGLLARWQLPWTRSGITNALSTGRIEPVRRSVYRVAGSPRTWEQGLMAACLARRGAVVSGRAAAALWELDGFRAGRTEISVPGTKHVTMDGVIVHASTVHGPVHASFLRGIPVTSVARTLCDLTNWCSAGTVGRAVDEALRRELVDLVQLREVFRDLEGRGRKRCTLMREVLEVREVDHHPGDSNPEVRLTRLLVSSGLPRPVQQHHLRVKGRTIRIDLSYPEQRVAIEYDGWAFHSTRSAFDRDRARGNELEVLGWTVLRFTSQSPDASIIGTVRAAITRRAVG